jgi:presenilin-like A22 family membrane protease
MKHPVHITLLLLLLFVASQLIGLALLSHNISEIKHEAGQTIVVHDTTALGDRPQTQGGESLLLLLAGVGVGTALLLLLIRFQRLGIWRVWFLAAVWLSLTIAFGVLVPTIVALLTAAVLAVWKVFWPNPLIHNLTEVFMYAGLAVLIVPILSLWYAVALLVIISLHDMYAVWRSKHMVVMAEAQAKSNIFAGLYIPKHAGGTRRTAVATQAATQARSSPATPPSLNRSAAILGGGDIAFPLLFSGVVMDWLITRGVTRTAALYETTIITLTTAIALALLLFLAKKDRFYPAMPFVTAGCFVGLGIVALL